MRAPGVDLLHQGAVGGHGGDRREKVCTDAVLAFGRQLGAYVVAADLIKL
ncbi:MAG: hypothetical protein M3N29_09155 [Chloroflexota bacterium]|nr:hypothetical protein [Chloroflexota bacterium]